MWNLRSLKMSVMLLASGIAVVVALPVKAQQVVLTPAGTMIQPMPQAPVAEKSILNYMMSGEQRETTYYPGEIAPGTGVDTEYRPGPVEVTKVTGPILEIDPDALIGGPGGVKYSELAKGNKPDSSRTYTPEELAEAYRRGEISFYPEIDPYLHRSSAANQVGDTNLSSQSVPTVAPGGITGAASFSAATASGSGGISGSVISTPLTVVPTVSQPMIANQVASPVTSVTVRASQNPTADFATTRSAPRNTIPEQLNQGVIDSPLSSSRIFPGMR